MPSNSASAAPPSPALARRRIWLGVGAIVAAVVVAYFNSLRAPLFFDDTASIVHNESIRQLWPLDKVLFAPAVAGTAGRPLLNLSYALNYAMGGLSPVGYHVGNILIHAAAALALYGLVRRILLLPYWQGRFADSARLIAELSALLWAAHPLQTESVTYISQRAESLVGLFYLVTWYTFVRTIEVGAKRRWAVLSVAACVAGMLTKEIMVTAPFVIAVFDRVFVGESWAALWRRRRGIYLGYVAAWGTLGALMLTSRLFTRGVGFGGEISPIKYAMMECEAFALYLKLCIWPHPLVIDYGPTPARGGVWLVLGAAVVVAWVGGVLWLSRRRRALAFAGFVVLALLAPTTSFVPVGFQPIAEHRMYLPLAVILPTLVTLAWLGFGRHIFAVGLVVWGVLTATVIARNTDYATEVSIWRDAAVKRPDNWRAHATLGLAYLREQRLAEGIAAIEAALKVNSTESKVYNNYANVLSVAGRLPEALAAGGRAVELAPDYAEARSTLAGILLKAGRVAEAAGQLEAARRLKPDSVEIRSNLCDVLRRAGRAPEAVTEGEAALRLDSAFPVAHCNLGLALVDVGRIDEAIAHYQTALRLKPDYLDVRNNLGVTLMNAGRLAEAQVQLEEAIRFAPDYAEAHNSLGIVYAKQGRIDDGIREFETALRLQPGHVQARDNLKIVQGMRPAQP